MITLQYKYVSNLYIAYLRLYNANVNYINKKYIYIDSIKEKRL